MQRTIISLAVAWACRKIGEEYVQRQRIAAFDAKAQAARQVVVADASVKA